MPSQSSAHVSGQSRLNATVASPQPARSRCGQIARDHRHTRYPTGRDVGMAASARGGVARRSHSELVALRVDYRGPATSTREVVDHASDGSPRHALHPVWRQDPGRRGGRPCRRAPGATGRASLRPGTSGLRSPALVAQRAQLGPRKYQRRDLSAGTCPGPSTCINEELQRRRPRPLQPPCLRRCLSSTSSSPVTAWRS